MKQLTKYLAALAAVLSAQQAAAQPGDLPAADKAAFDELILPVLEAVSEGLADEAVRVYFATSPTQLSESNTLGLVAKLDEALETYGAAVLCTLAE